MNTCTIIESDCRTALNNFKQCADLIITSPPYADARKKHYGGIHPNQFSEWFLSFHEPFWNALKEDGSLVINIKDKIIEGVRHRYVWETITKLSKEGWFCIDDYIWQKSNPMPGYWPSRLRDGWEYCFHLSKTKRPYMDQTAVHVPVGNWTKTRLQNLGMNDHSRHNSKNASGFGRDVSKWVGKTSVLPSNVITAALVGKNKKHPAVFPIELPIFFIKLLSRKNSLVIDPFGGSGTTGVAALKLGRDALLIDNHLKYCKLAEERIKAETDTSLIKLMLIRNTIEKNSNKTEENIYKIPKSSLFIVA